MNDSTQQRPPYVMAGLVVLGVFLLYVVTLAPTTQFWDTSEYIAAAYVLGIPHPPGNPLFTLVAHVWGDALFFVEHYAKRINLFAASTSAIAAGCWFLIGERWLRTIVPALWPRRMAALAGALVSATAFTVWNQSVVNEKVYTLSLLSVALVFWLIVRWDDQPPGEGHDHYLLMIVYLLALTSTNHMMGVLVGPVVAVLLFPPLKPVVPGVRREDEWAQFAVFAAVLALLVGAGLESVGPVVAAGILYLVALGYAFYTGNTRFALAALGVAAIGLTVYLSLPLRAAHFPAINEGEPTNWQALWSVLTREQYGKPPVSQRQATMVAQVGMWWQYFTWQWGRDFPAGLQRGLAIVFAALGLLGAWRHWRADRRAAFAMTVLMATFTLLLIFYLNFKHGYSQYLDHQSLLDLERVAWRKVLRVAVVLASGLITAWPNWNRDTAPAKVLAAGVTLLALAWLIADQSSLERLRDQSALGGSVQIAREVRERDYFYLASFALWGLWVGLGLATLMEWIRDGLRTRMPDETSGWMPTTIVLVIALVPLFGNRLTASRAGETIARDFASDLLQSVEPYGILVTAGDNDTFPLWYAQEVEGIRQDVTVLNLSLANTDWYLRQLQRRPLADFVPERAPAVYQGREWPKPEGKLFDWSDDVLAGLELYYVLDKPQTVQLGPLAVSLNPEWIGRQYLERADVAVLQAIRDHLGGRRPIYFSRTVGLYADQFGLTAYLEGHGFARKLNPQPLAASDSVIAVPSLGYINLPRSRALLFDVYHSATAARHRPRGWLDNPSEGILALYGVTYQTIGSVLQPRDSTLGERALAIADSVYRNTSIQLPPGN